MAKKVTFINRKKAIIIGSTVSGGVLVSSAIAIGVTVPMINKQNEIKSLDIDLSRLHNNIQNYIDESSRKYSLEEFRNNIQTEEFKNKLASWLGIDSSLISKISVSSVDLQIQPINNSKFETISNLPNNVEIDNTGTIVISNLKLWTAYNLSQYKIDNFKNTLNSYIKNNRLSKFNDSDLQNIISSDLGISKNDITIQNDINSKNYFEIKPKDHVKFVSNSSNLINNQYIK
ncbi:MAG: hypothetical protein K2L64_03550, partial [Ureaplasma sp.]|nr:hypothetical protein [Ureaplasma sp.]